MARRGKLPEETRNYVRNITGQPAERWARVNAPTEGKVLPPHARCPGMPVIEVSVPEAAPVRIAKSGAKGKSKAGSKVAAMPEELPKLAAAKVAGPKMPKSFTLASASPGKQMALIRNGKIQIIAPEKGRKPAPTKPAPTKTAAAAKDVKSASKSAAKAAAKSPAKPAAELAAKSQSKPPGGKRVKVAAAR
jgi:hypothetical protein